MAVGTIRYEYHHMPIGGGGYVTGFFFHPLDEKVMYCRTDIGGMYRFDTEKDAWVSLADGVCPPDLRLACPISAALDAHRPGRLFVISGNRGPDSKGLLSISEDYGRHFVNRELPVFVHGNLHGRGAGERLCFEKGRLWLASQTEGLWLSDDEGRAWQKAAHFPESGCTFVTAWGQQVLVGTEGLVNSTGESRGCSLYLSKDGGETFSPLPQPQGDHVPGSRLQGLVAQRCSMDETYLYVSFSANGPRSQSVERGYSCDSGDSSSGRIARYALEEDGGVGTMEDITPEKGPFGYSAVNASHGLLIAAAINQPGGDSIYLSRDKGKTWQKVLQGLKVGKMAFGLSYMQPKYNGGGNLVHWMTDVKMDPHRPGVAWFNTGTGVFRTKNLTDETVVWQDTCNGMEETVHINVHAPATGRVLLMDMVGDLGGFAFTDVNRHCENTFADAEGNRYITCLSCDWPDSNPAHMVVCARGNWTGKTKGGLIITKDGAQTWQRLPMPMGLNGKLDGLLQRISGVNVNAGWVAVSADGERYVWAPADRIFLRAENLLVTSDGGKTFRLSRVTDENGMPAQGLLKPVADRCDPMVFYGFGDQGELYVSRDGGETFCKKTVPEGFPKANFGLVDCADRTEIRVAGGENGVIYTATGEGLWKLRYHKDRDVFEGHCLTSTGDRAFCVGLGLGRPGGNYFTEQKMVYFSGVIDGEYGFYRTPDDGKTVLRINNENQMFGSIHSIDGDKRVFGRFFLGTGTSGLLYGKEAERNDTK